MVQFHNAPSNFANLVSRGDRHWLSEPTTCFRITGKEICFHKIGPIMMPKRQGGHPYSETKFPVFSLTKFSFPLTKILRFYNLFAFSVKNNSKKAYQLVKELTTEKQGKSTTINDKSGKFLTEENEFFNRWAEYCSDLYYYETDGDPIVLDSPHIPGEKHHSIL